LLLWATEDRITSDGCNHGLRRRCAAHHIISCDVDWTVMFCRKTHAAHGKLHMKENRRLWNKPTTTAIPENFSGSGYQCAMNYKVLLCGTPDAQCRRKCTYAMHSTNHATNRAPPSQMAP
jgi:hypothetical protein